MTDHLTEARKMIEDQRNDVQPFVRAALDLAIAHLGALLSERDERRQAVADVLDWIYSGMECQSCGGIGKDWSGTTYQTCRKCAGTGRRPEAQAAMEKAAELFGLDRQADAKGTK